jgi:hypothetical protein
VPINVAGLSGNTINPSLARENRALREENAHMRAKMYALRLRERDVAERERRLLQIEEELIERKSQLCEAEAKREAASHSLHLAQKYAANLETQLVEQKLKVFQLNEKLQDMELMRLQEQKKRASDRALVAEKCAKRRKSFSFSSSDEYIEV